MHNLLLIAFLSVPPVAPPVEPPPVAPPVELPDHAGEPIVAVEPCQCGDVCECDPCECPGCPHRAVKQSLTAQPPHLVASVWTSGCVYGERWLSEAYPELIAKGWRIEVRRVSPDSGVACPTFTMGTRTWSGYTSKAAHFAALRDNPASMTPSGTTPVNRAKPVQIHHAVPRSVPPARRQWSYSGSNLAEHLRQTHGVDPTGMSHRDMVNAHSHAHEGTWNGVASGARYSQPVYSSGCPGGNCPSSSRSRGLFGGLFR